MRARISAWASFGALIAALAGSCGDSDGAAASGPTLEEVGDMLADTYCDLFVGCLPADAVEAYFGPGGCLARFQASIDDGDLPEIERAVDEGRATYHPDQVDACFQTVRAFDCLDIEGVRVFQQGVCAGVFVGTVSVGGACLVDVECIGNRFCDRSVGCPGTCTELLAEGSNCEDDDQCSEGLTCDGQSSTCEMHVREGRSCGGGVAPDCALGLTCAGDDEAMSRPGTCAPHAQVLVGALGASCNPDTGQLCAEGLSCMLGQATASGATFSCVEAVASGAACSVGIPDPCPLGEYCAGLDLQASDFDGTCTALPAASEPCVESFAGSCAPGLLCAGDQICYALGRIGDDCYDDDGCASENCDGGSCAAPEVCAL